jgi:hypothetical protein
MVKDLALDYCIQILICTHTYTLQYLTYSRIPPLPSPHLALVTQSILHERGLSERRDPAGSDSRWEEGSETGSLLALLSYLCHCSRPFITLSFAPIFTQVWRGARRMIFLKAEEINKLLNCLLFLKYNSIGFFTFVFQKVQETFFLPPPPPTLMKCNFPVFLTLLHRRGREAEIMPSHWQKVVLPTLRKIIPQKNPVEKQFGPCL